MGARWLKFPCRYSVSGCLEITPDSLQIRPGSELHLEQWWMAAYHSVKHIDRAWWMFLCHSRRFFFLPVYKFKRLFSASWYFSVCARLEWLEQPPRIWGITAWWEEGTWQRREWKSVYPFSFSRRLKCGSFFFTLSGWAVSGVLWRRAGICLPRLSVYIQDRRRMGRCRDRKEEERETKTSKREADRRKCMQKQAWNKPYRGITNR